MHNNRLRPGIRISRKIRYLRCMIAALLADKTKKPKQKTEALADALCTGHLSTDELLRFAASAKDAARATCIESLEFASRTHPEIATDAVFTFVVGQLSQQAPRVLWESAKVIGNIAAAHRDKLDKAIAALMPLSTHPGTVVRWSCAFALGEILKVRQDPSFLKTISGLAESEEKESIQKIYRKALKAIAGKGN